MKIEKKNSDNQNFKPKKILQTTYIYCLKDKIEPESFSNKKISYKFDGNFKTSYYKHQEKNGSLIFRLPENVTPHKIKKLNFPNCDRSKVSWGKNWSRLSHCINNVMPFNSLFIDYASNSTVCNMTSLQFLENKITLMWLKANEGAVLRCNQYVWFNWFFYKKNYYIQILYEQYAETWGSLIGGAMWMNLGDYLIVDLF